MLDTVECIEDTIDKDSNASTDGRIIRPVGVEAPHIDALPTWILDIKQILGHLEYFAAPTVVLNGILGSFIIALEDTQALPLKPALSGPAVPEGFEDRCVDSWCDKLGKDGQTPVNASGLGSRNPSESPRGVTPPPDLLPNSLHWVPGCNVTNGLHARALSFFLNFLHSIIIPFIGIQLADGHEDALLGNAQSFEVI